MLSGTRIELFGGLRVIQGDQVIQRFQTQKTGALLAYLALNSHRSFGRETIAELLWPGGDSVAIRNRLNQAVSSLRRQLHAPGSTDGPVLAAGHHSIGMNAALITTDVADFLELVDRAASSANAAQAVALQEQAIKLYKGDLMDGYDDRIFSSERIRLRDILAEMLSSVMKFHAAEGSMETAIDAAHRRLMLDPANERLHRTLMRLYLKAGRPMSATAQFTELERMLKPLGSAPSQRSQELYNLASNMAPNATGAANSPMFVPDRIENLSLPSRSDRSIVTPKLALPKFLSRFIGRETESSALISTFNEEESHWVTLTGLGGTGKSRLAIYVAERLSENFQNRCFFTSFVGEGASTDALALIANSALSSTYGSDVTVADLESDLRGHSRTLLVLDNLESLNAEQLDSISQIVRRCPGVSVLGTSRMPVGVEGEHIFPLLPLPVPEAAEGSTLEELGSNPAVALFVDRAKLARQDFQLTERSAEAIANVCRRLEGLPLALELAASWARTLTPTQMLEQVSIHYDRLHSRRRDISQRHQSLSTALAGSYELISIQAQRALAAAAVFEDGFYEEYLQGVMSEVDVKPLIAELADYSLIRPIVITDSVRYMATSLVRAFALDHSPNQEQNQRLHAEFFLRRCQEWPDYRLVWLAQNLLYDRRNLVVALQYFLDDKNWEAAATIGRAVIDLSEMTGWWVPSIALINRYIEETSGNASVAGFRSRFIERLSSIPFLPQITSNQFQAIDQVDEENQYALTRARASQSIYRRKFLEAAALLDGVQFDELPTEDLIASSILKVRALTEVGRLEEANVAARKAIELAAPLEMSIRLSRIFVEMAWLGYSMGDREGAGDYIEHSTSTLKHYPDRTSRLRASTLLALISLDQEDYEASRRAVMEILPVVEPNALGYEEILALVAVVLAYCDQFELAAEALGNLDFEQKFDHFSSGVDRLGERLKVVAKFLRSSLGSGAFDRRVTLGQSKTRAEIHARILTSLSSMTVVHSSY